MDSIPPQDRKNSIDSGCLSAKVGNVEMNMQHGTLDLQATKGSIAVGTFKEQSFSLLSIFGIGYSVTNTAMAILASMATGIGSGGPVLFVWGQIGIFLISLCIACSLAELASAMPNAAGQLYWVGKLAPRRFAGGLSYITGMMAWASAVCICASGTLLTPQMAIGMYILRRPDFNYHPWMGFVGFQATNIFVFFFNTIERFLPIISKGSLMFSATSTVIIFTTMLARSPAKQSAEFVFTDFVNMSGWKDAIAGLIGILGINWGYSCLDACTHMAEEVPEPERNVPKALFATVGVGLLTGLPISIALLFCITNIEDIIATPTMVPSLQLFDQVFRGSSAGPIGLQCLIINYFPRFDLWCPNMAGSALLDLGSTKRVALLAVPWQSCSRSFLCTTVGSRILLRLRGYSGFRLSRINHSLQCFRWSWIIVSTFDIFDLRLVSVLAWKI